MVDSAVMHWMSWWRLAPLQLLHMLLRLWLLLLHVRQEGVLVLQVVVVGLPVSPWGRPPAVSLLTAHGAEVASPLTLAADVGLEGALHLHVGGEATHKALPVSLGHIFGGVLHHSSPHHTG